jgi:hypothetical protein
MVRTKRLAKRRFYMLRRTGIGRGLAQSRQRALDVFRSRIV